MNSNDIILGIDFGSQNIRSCAYNGTKFEPIYNTSLKPSTPSCVSFGKEIFVGDRAKTVLKRNRVTGLMNVLGRNCNEPLIQNLIFKNNANLVNMNGHPEYTVTFRGELLSLKPETIAALILNDARSQSEHYMGGTASEVVVTVPLHFNQIQRQAVLNAAKIAGINVIQIVNETTAAAIAYYHKRRNPRKVLVYHMGAFSFDFSIINLTREGVSVLHSSGGHNLGGSYINDVILKWVLQKLSDKGIDDINSLTEEKLYESIEAAKIDLMSPAETIISDGSDIDIELKRLEFNELVYSKVISKTLDIVKNSLAEWNLTKSDITEVLLIGGCCKMEILKQSIEDEFTVVQSAIHNDDMVSRGAAILGAIINNKLPNTFQINELIQSSILLNKEIELRNELIKINLNTNDNPVVKSIEIYMDDDKPHVSVSYSIDHNGILKLTNATECEDMNEGTFKNLRTQMQYLTSQNINIQEIKEALNSLRKMVDEHMSLVQQLNIPMKYKEIYRSIKKEVFLMKADEKPTISSINCKERCVQNYISFIKELNNRT